MAHVQLEINGKVVEIYDPSLNDSCATWRNVMSSLLIPALSAHGYFVEHLYSVDELQDV
jgi:hypothetical protein